MGKRPTRVVRPGFHRWNIDNVPIELHLKMVERAVKNRRSHSQQVVIDMLEFYKSKPQAS